MIHRRSLAAAFAASVALLLTIPIGLAAANGADGDGDGVSDETESDTERIVVPVVDADKLKVASSLFSEFVEDQFRVSYEAGKFEVWYRGTAGTEVAYELEFRRLIEWVDSNQNGKIDDRSEIVYESDLGSAAFGGVPILASHRTNPDGGQLHTFIAPSTLGDVILTLSVGERFTRLSNQRILTPMELKIDVAVDRTFSSASVNLGIELRLETEGRVEFGQASWASLHGFASSEASLNITGGTQDHPAVAFFSWAKTALANGRAIPVNVTHTSVDERTNELYFAYPMVALGFPSRIQLLHDPSIGVESPLVIVNPAAPRGDVLLYVLSVAGVAAVVVSTVVVARWRSRNRKD